MEAACIVKPIFADTEFNRRIDRYLRRGRSLCTVGMAARDRRPNLLKLWRHTTAAAMA